MPPRSSSRCLSSSTTAAHQRREHLWAATLNPRCLTMLAGYEFWLRYCIAHSFGPDFQSCAALSCRRTELGATCLRAGFQAASISCRVRYRLPIFMPSQHGGAKALLAAAACCQ
jgi:hypothetical protein